MSCKLIKMENWPVALVNMKHGHKLTENEAKVLMEYLDFCRKRSAKKKAKIAAQRREQK